MPRGELMVKNKSQINKLKQQVNIDSKILEETKLQKDPIGRPIYPTTEHNQQPYDSATKPKVEFVQTEQAPVIQALREIKEVLLRIEKRIDERDE